jgi:hypothetical protein
MNWYRTVAVWAALAAVAVPAPAGWIFNRKNSKPDPNERVTELLSTLKNDGDEVRRENAAEELRHFDAGTNPNIVPTLVEALEHDSKPGVRAEAAATLGRLRPLSQEAGQALEQALARDPSMRVRLQARSSLMHYYMAGYHGGKNPDAPPSTSTEGRQAGSTEGRQAGSTEGRQAGSTEGRQAGSTEGRQAGEHAQTPPVVNTTPVQPSNVGSPTNITSTTNRTVTGARPSGQPVSPPRLRPLPAETPPPPLAQPPVTPPSAAAPQALPKGPAAPAPSSPLVPAETPQLQPPLPSQPPAPGDRKDDQQGPDLAPPPR